MPCRIAHPRSYTRATELRDRSDAGLFAALRADHGVDRAVVLLDVGVIGAVGIDDRLDHGRRLLLRRRHLGAQREHLVADVRILDREAERLVVLEAIDRADLELAGVP